MKAIRLQVFVVMVRNPESWKGIGGMQEAMLRPVSLSAIGPYPQTVSSDEKRMLLKADPWGNSYLLRLKKGASEVPIIEIISKGPNHILEDGGGDDIVFRVDK